MIKILTILGARPQFIKAAVVSRELINFTDVEEVIVHTGQHYQINMSKSFFKELNIPKPKYNLNINKLQHGAMVGRMIESIEILIQKEQPQWVLVYGDTNSTLAGALASAKLKIPLIHIEAGLRSYNLAMPEEINRVLTDRISDLLLCPTEVAIQNLRKEGFPYRTANFKTQKIKNIGDVMFDATLYYSKRALEEISLEKFGLQNKGYALCTLHRQENVDNFINLKNILSALRNISKNLPVVFPIHPRTKSKLINNKEFLKNLIVIEPLSYISMQRLQISAKLILTDSGGVQKEAYFHKTPCITLRNETEWTETVASGWNKLVGSEERKIVDAAKNFKVPKKAQPLYFGDGNAAKNICKLLI